MPRFYFHLHECGTDILDEEGQELSDVEAAREQAIIAARAVMCDEVSHGRLCLSCRIEIADGDGRTLLTVPFKEALSINGS